jgi:hypothetical protein
LFTYKFFYGVGLFCIVQIIYIYRHGAINKKSIGDFILKTLLVITTALLIFNYLGFFKKEGTLITVSIYSSLIIAGTVIAYFGKNYEEKFYINKKLIFYGMFLFLLCDVNVGLSNLSIITFTNGIMNIIRAYSWRLIWLFYLPSQVLLSLSGEKMS